MWEQLFVQVGLPVAAGCKQSSILLLWHSPFAKIHPFNIPFGHKYFGILVNFCKHVNHLGQAVPYLVDGFCRVGVVGSVIYRG